MFGKKNNERQISQNLRNENDFALPIPRIEQFKKFPIYSLPLEWNNAGELIFWIAKCNLCMKNVATIPSIVESA